MGREPSFPNIHAKAGASLYARRIRGCVLRDIRQEDLRIRSARGAASGAEALPGLLAGACEAPPQADPHHAENRCQ